MAAAYPQLDSVTALTPPETVLEMLRKKYKRCAATAQDEVTATGMLRGAFWVIAGYWLPYALGAAPPAESLSRSDTEGAARWGYAFDHLGRTQHAEKSPTDMDNVVVNYPLSEIQRAQGGLSAGQ